MKIIFDKQDPSEVIEKIKEKLLGRKLGRMVVFNLDQSNNLEVIIKKLGTSKIAFSYQEIDASMEWHLSKEQISLSHKAFKNEVLNKIVNIVEHTGGKVIA